MEMKKWKEGKTGGKVDLDRRKNFVGDTSC